MFRSGMREQCTDRTMKRGLTTGTRGRRVKGMRIVGGESGSRECEAKKPGEDAYNIEG